MLLTEYLKKHKKVSGPLEKNSSYSHACGIKGRMLNEVPLPSNAYYLLEGSAVHEVFLQSINDSYKKLAKGQKTMVDGMVTALRKHPIVTKLTRDAVTESKQYTELFGQLISFILDIEQVQQRVGSDIKTTTAITFTDCLSKAIQYGYAGQSWTYKKVRNLKKFFFIFVSKKKVNGEHPIFIIDSVLLKKHEAYKEREMEFLMYIYKHYGNIL